jgi:hypothetical protein
VPSLDVAARLLPDAPFVVSPADDDAAVMAAARKRFLFPTTVTYCNTGTLGAIPRDVMEVVVKGLQQLERDLPDWPYFQADGQPLTGYQPLTSEPGARPRSGGCATDWQGCRTRVSGRRPTHGSRRLSRRSPSMATPAASFRTHSG